MNSFSIKNDKKNVYHKIKNVEYYDKLMLDKHTKKWIVVKSEKLSEETDRHLLRTVF